MKMQFTESTKNPNAIFKLDWSTTELEVLPFSPIDHIKNDDQYKEL